MAIQAYNPRLEEVEAEVQCLGQPQLSSEMEATLGYEILSPTQKQESGKVYENLKSQNTAAGKQSAPVFAQKTTQLLFRKQNTRAQRHTRNPST